MLRHKIERYVANKLEIETTLFERKSISTQILRYKEVIKCMPAQKVSCNIWHSFRAWFEMHDATNIPGMLGFPNIYVLIIFVWNQAEFLYFQMIKEKLKRGGNSMNTKSISAWYRTQILFTSSYILLVWYLFQNIPGLDIWCLCVQMQWLAETYMNRFFIVRDDIYWFSWRTCVS